jgi:hypothetical protein
MSRTPIAVPIPKMITIGTVDIPLPVRHARAPGTTTPTGGSPSCGRTVS